MNQSAMQTEIKTKYRHKHFLYSFPLFILVLLYFTNPKRFDYKDKDMIVQNSAINRIEQMLQKVESNIFGQEGK